MIKKIAVFFAQTKEELKKVSWTKKEELLSSTTVVVITVIILCIYIWIVDLAEGNAVDFILK